jgi:hypothetical protein
MVYLWYTARRPGPRVAPARSPGRRSGPRSNMRPPAMSAGLLARGVSLTISNTNTTAQFASRKSAAFFLKAQSSAFSFHGGTTVPLSAGDSSHHRPVMNAHTQRSISDGKIQEYCLRLHLDTSRRSAMKRRNKLPLSWSFSHINLPLGWPLICLSRDDLELMGKGLFCISSWPSQKMTFSGPLPSHRDEERQCMSTK